MALDWIANDSAAWLEKRKQPVIESSAPPKTRPPTEVARKTTKRKGRGLVEVVGIGLLVDCPLLGVTMLGHRHRTRIPWHFDLGRSDVVSHAEAAN
jgi:hypothetical protein